MSILKKWTHSNFAFLAYVGLTLNTQKENYENPLRGTCNNLHDPYMNYKAAEILKGLSSQFYPQLHYWATVFFTLRIQILSFLENSS